MILNKIVVWCVDYSDWYEWTVYSWTFKFREVVGQQIWGEVADFIPASCTVHLEMQEWLVKELVQESRAVTRKPRDAVHFGLMFTDIHHKFE